MSTDDPFAVPDSERTIILPTPGGPGARRAQVGAAPSEDFTEQARFEPGGINGLVAAANPLLDIVPQLRATVQHPDPARLRDSLVRAIRSFEARAQAVGVRPEHIIAARYVLCTLIDEAAAGTPWGASGTWSSRSLLVTFHNEAWGGEKFFQLLSKLAQDPAANADLLELMYVCLALGFKGRYQVLDNGTATLEALREKLAGMLRRQRGEHERALSPHWRGASPAAKTLFTALPLWIASGLIGVLAALAYFAFDFSLNAKSDPVYGRIAVLGQGAAPAMPAPPPPPRPRLAALLAPDIGAGALDVVDEANRSVVMLRGDRLFQPGSAQVDAQYGPTLQRVARALAAVPGPVRVIGHTDNQPVRSPRFPSNWHLSLARAEAVAALLEAAPERLRAEGRADAEPLGPNGTPQQRARNRRVEIILTAQPAGGR